MFQHGKTLAQQGPPNQTDPLLTYFLIIIILILVILVAVILYRYFSPNLTRVKPSQSLQQQTEQQAEKPLSESKNLVPEITTTNENNDNEALQKARVEAAIQVLTEDEKRIVEVLLAAAGTMLQKEISWKTGYSRVKTHRVLVRLIRRGVVSAEKYYNTNKISFSVFLLGKNGS